jgi:hypothetical protein
MSFMNPLKTDDAFSMNSTTAMKKKPSGTRVSFYFASCIMS